MRSRILMSALASLLSMGTLAGVANANVPGWSREAPRTTKLYASACATQAQQAIQSVTGVAPTKVQFDSFTYEIRGFTANVGIFAYCTTSPVALCPNRPAADLVILTFSSVSSADATAKGSAVNTAFGNPRLFDCN